MNKFKNLRGCVDKVSTLSRSQNKHDLKCVTGPKILGPTGTTMWDQKSLIPHGNKTKNIHSHRTHLFTQDLIKGQIRPKANLRIKLII